MTADGSDGNIPLWDDGGPDEFTIDVRIDVTRAEAELLRSLRP